MTILRRAIQALALIAIIVLLPLTLMGLWARSEIYDTDTYLNSVGNLASNSKVQAAVAFRITLEAERQLSGTSWQSFVESTVQDPDVKAELLAIDPEITAYLEDAIVSMMQTPEFQKLWIDVNREAHPLLEQILRGEDTEAVQASDGMVALNLYPMYRQLETTFFGAGVDLSATLSLDREDFWLTVFEGDRLAQAQEAVWLLNRGLAVALVLLVTLPIVYLIVSRRRWLAAAMLGLAILLGMILHAALLGSAREFLIDATASETEREAVRVVFDEITDSLWISSGIVAVAGLALLVLFLIGHFVRRRQDPYAIDW